MSIGPREVSMPIIADLVIINSEKLHEAMGKLLVLAFAAADVLAIASLLPRKKAWRWALFGAPLALTILVFLSGFWHLAGLWHLVFTPGKIYWKIFSYFLFVCASMVFIALVPLIWRRRKNAPAAREGSEGSVGRVP
jgi:hypothetical protein